MEFSLVFSFSFSVYGAADTSELLLEIPKCQSCVKAPSTLRNLFTTDSDMI
jgi:hypothetical protein